MKNKGFTLVELLVVISIIAMLLAVLMPSLNMARDQARTIVCETNLKQLGTAWVAFAVDNDGALVTSYEYRDDNDSITMTGTEWVWAPTEVATGKTVKNREPTIQERHEGIKRGAFYRYAANLGVFHCPSDKTQYNHFRTYSIPDCMNGIMKYTVGSYHRWECLTKITQVKRPVEKYIFIEENDFRTYNMGSWMPFYDTQYVLKGDPMVVWHSGKCKSSMAFADGHCEQRRWSKEVADYFINFKTFRDKILITEGGKEDWKWLEKGWATLAR